MRYNHLKQEGLNQKAPSMRTKTGLTDEVNPVFVRMIGLEPTRREALPPESSVSTNFTTCASEKWDKDR